MADDVADAADEIVQADAFDVVDPFVGRGPFMQTTFEGIVPAAAFPAYDPSLRPTSTVYLCRVSRNSPSGRATR